MKNEDQDEIVGYIERITYQNGENGYTVAQLQQPKRTHLTCIVGCMPAIQPGETVRCKGSWKQHLIHGRQFTVSEFSLEAPADLVGIQKYLGSGLIKGIGPVYAGRIVEKFGVDTLNVIDRDPRQLLEIAGLGEKRIEKIKSCWAEQKSIRDVMVFLQTYGVSPTYAQKIFKRYGELSIAKVKENPFNLAKDIFGIGFKTADAIAEKMGIAKEAPQRIDSGIEYVLGQLSNEGHVCYPLTEFLREAKAILEVPAGHCDKRIDFLKNEGHIVVFDLMHGPSLTAFIWLKSLFMAEVGIAGELKRLREAPCTIRSIETFKAIEWVQEKLNIQLALHQKDAVAGCLSDKLHIVTGGPGTGKSTITNATLTVAGKLTSRIILAAPTGRAAKRMSEITGKKASTIHSLLEYDFKTGGFKRNRQSPLECDLLIVDEASMIDTLLMYHLLKAVPDSCRVVFVGDIHQLPSVGPGNVLKDIIQSHTIPVTMLTEIYRQAAGSRIVTNAHSINKGIFPDIRNQSESDFYFMEALTPEAVLENIVSLVSDRLPKKYAFDPLNDIQVLAPMKKGMIGTENLNCVLQDLFHPKGVPLFRAGRKFMVGDKVMQIRNDYKKEVFNGDIGRVKEILLMEQQMVVQMNEMEVAYDFSELDELLLAYAVSVHKYQGSECPCVIIPVHTTHFKLLFRNLLYTGVTRGKKLVILVGSKKALAIAVKNDEVLNRHTGLKQALIGTIPLSSRMR